MAKSEIVDQLVILAEAFGLSFNDARMEIYAECLADLPIDKIKFGIVRLIKTRSFAGNLPTVAEIREAATGGAGAIALRIVTAWDKFMYALNRHAPYDSVQFDDPIICHIVRQWGGWTEMGDWPASETKWKRKEFEKLYEAYAVSDNLPEPDQHLIGLTEANNRALYPEFVPKPILITGETGRFLSLPYEPVQQLRLAN